eukprot:1038597-Amphidinium_carterae.2
MQGVWKKSTVLPKPPCRSSLQDGANATQVGPGVTISSDLRTAMAHSDDIQYTTSSNQHTGSPEEKPQTRRLEVEPLYIHGTALDSVAAVCAA